MNYIQFFLMRPEVSLLGFFLIIFLYDLVSTGRYRRFFHPIVCFAMLLHTAVCLRDTSEQTLFAGMYHSNAMIVFVKAMLSFGTVIVIMQSHRWVRTNHTYYKQGEFYTLLLSTLVGMYFMISARHFLLLFVGIELASLPMACLVAFDKYRHHSAEAGLKYILTSMFASAIMLYGISFLYGTTGSLYFDEVRHAISSSSMQTYALVMFFAGMGFKISIVPFHMWTPDSYEGAPTAVTAYLSAISKGAAVFTLFTVLTTVFAPMIEQWQTIIYATTAAGITLANLFALKQKNLKRFMAFSSISQAGYIMLAVIGGRAQDMSAMVYYLLVYMAANLAVFGVIGSVEHQIKREVRRSTLNGFYATNPRLSLLMTLALFSLAGIPPFAGFFSKFFVFASAFGAGFKVLVFVALVNTVISLFYYLLIVKAIYIEKSDNPVPRFTSSIITRLSLVACLVGIIALGLCSFVYNFIADISFGL